jgi:hypothetical protein
MAFNKYIGVHMQTFKPTGPVMTIVNLVLELDKYKKLYQKEKADNACLKRLLQTKKVFEVRV